jgi:phage tail-like protein
MILNNKRHWEKGLLDGLTVNGDRMAASPGQGIFHGAFFSAAIDSGERDFQWGRIRVEGELHDDVLLRCSLYAANSKVLSEGEPDLDAYLHAGYENVSTKTGKLNAIYTELHVGEGDFLAAVTGRYLFIKLELIMTGLRPAFVTGVYLQTDGDHMTDYLPAVYRREDPAGFTHRFLSIFNHITLDLEERIHKISRLLDYDTAGGEMLRYLASWVGVEAEGSDAEVRGQIREAAHMRSFSQTPAGVRNLVKRWTGHTPILLEHFNVADIIREGKDRALYEKLYGENPFRLFVILPEAAFRTHTESELFLEKLRGLLPAHIDTQLLLLGDGVYLDQHTYLGINSIMTSYKELAVNDNIALDFSTIVGEAPRDNSF